MDAQNSTLFEELAACSKLPTVPRIGACKSPQLTRRLRALLCS